MGIHEHGTCMRPERRQIRKTPVVINRRSFTKAAWSPGHSTASYLRAFRPEPRAQFSPFFENRSAGRDLPGDVFDRGPS